MDLVDVAVARRYFVGQCLTFMPHVGVRVAWIDQKYLASYLCIDSPNSTTITISSTNTTDSFGVGAKAGLETNWNFGCGLYFFGNTALSILYTDYDSIKIKLDSSTTVSDVDSAGTASFSTSACYLRPEADIALGLGWGDYFWCGKYYFDLTTAYEFHVFWDQNMLPANGDFSTIPSALRGNLYLHGLSVTARIDF